MVKLIDLELLNNGAIDSLKESIFDCIKAARRAQKQISKDLW